MMLPPYRVLPLIEDHRAWSAETYGETTNRILASASLARRILQALRTMGECPGAVAPYAEVFILAMDLAWRADGDEPVTTSVGLTEALGALRIKHYIASAIRELSGPYIPRGVDVMAWAMRACAEQGVSGDAFLVEVGRSLDLAKRRKGGIPFKIAA